MSEANFLTWFRQWKDVVTTLVAVIAIVVVVWQIRQTSQLEKNRIRRDQVAARASLSLTLAALAEYGRSMIKALAPLEAWLEMGQEGEVPSFIQPYLPPETVPAVERVISAYPDEIVAKALAALLGEVQVLQSRAHGLSADPEEIRIWSIAMKDNIVMAARIEARVNDLLPFAREGTDVATPSRDHVRLMLSVAGLRQAQYPRVWKTLEDQSPETG